VVEALVMQSADSDWFLRGHWLMTPHTGLMKGKEEIREEREWD